MAKAETIRVEVGPETMKVLKQIRDELKKANAWANPNVGQGPDEPVRLIESAAPYDR